MAEQLVDARRNAEAFVPLTEAVRHLIDATIMSDVDDVAAREARSLIESATSLLNRQRFTGDSFGVRCTVDGAPTAWGNVVMGLRNPIALPLRIDRSGPGKVTTEFVLGAAYEGPPGHVHGGICALILDHVLGSLGHEPGLWAATATLTIRYRRPTPLGQLRADGWVERHDGAKIFAAGHIADDQGPTVEAEGIFIRRPAGQMGIA